MSEPHYEPFPRACYEVDIDWRYLERHVALEQAAGLDLDPDFQRVHVWTDAQRIAYLEYMIRGGEVGRNLTIACSDWCPVPTPDYCLVDGKQRLETVRRFMRGELRPFGRTVQEFGELRITQSRFQWRVVECRTREDILRLYLNINGGGTPHTGEELAKVRMMLQGTCPGCPRMARPGLKTCGCCLQEEP